MKLNNKHRGLVLSSTFVGLVCGLVLTHQQAYAAQTPPVSNQQSQITTVSDNNLNQAAAVNPKSYSSNITSPTPVTHNVTPNTYNSPETGLAVKQPIASSDATTAVATPNTGVTVPVANETATSTNPENNKSVNPVTSSPTPDNSNTAAVNPATGSDTQTTGNPTTTAASSEQPETNIIDQGTWGTSKWDYTQEGADYILHLHAGTLGIPGKDKDDNGVNWDAGIGSLNAVFKSQLTKIIIDPGVISNQNSRGLFSHLRKLKTIQGLENLDTSQVTNMSRMFAFCESLTSLDVSHFDTSQVTDIHWMFGDCDYLTNLDVTHFNTSQVTNMRNMFGDCHSLLGLDVSRFDTSQVTDMSSMFVYCVSLTNLDLSNFDTSQVTNMSDMFYGCERLTNLDLNHFDTSQVTDMHEMFEMCYNLTSLDVSHFNTSQVTDMSEMFGDCDYLTNLDVTHFNTSQVTNMRNMFGDCPSLLGLDVSRFDTSQVTNMSYMFSYCNSLTNLDLSHFNTSRVTDMSNMFSYSSRLTSLDVSHFDTSQVTDMDCMFDDCENLADLNLSNWDTSKVINMSEMFSGCNNLHHLVLGSKTQLIDLNGVDSALPAVPAACTKIPGTDRVVTAPYWVATSGYQQGQRYTSKELEQLTGRDQVTTYDWASQPLFASTVNSKVVTRTINVHNPDGTTHSEKQTVMLSQEIKNNADGTQTVGPWSTAQWAAYAIPEIAGYTANPSTVAAQTVNEKTQEQTVDVYYEPVLQQITVNYLDNGKIVGTQILSGYAGETIIPQYRAPKGYEILDQPQGQVSFTTAQQQIIQVAVQARILKTSETKSLIRTVNIHRPSGTIQTYRQPVVLIRTVYVNAVNGAKSYGSWSVGSWDAVPIPVITGYTASQAQVAAQQVTAQDSDQLLDIYYTKA
ncbi:BspA family leucine-rich repeat surface protein [Lactobacillus mellis]|uniref:BspA family leucine-rich repeat surface protein n=1 Tax=Bombilactobacillus mellis TaxID=1218508 RepID=UPI001580789C|nr:BspA family leucine-rich repeat surface protein [Bombilactobacillus mellis]NUG39027.1 BspA family leucine-rich repeat surface protein [Bombilactobacillus mellis]